VDKMTFIEALDMTNRLLNDIVFMLENRAKPTYFTRNAIMKFKDLILFSMNMVKKSLQLELDDYFKMKGSELNIRKQSYSEARLKILPEAFIKLFYHIVEEFYKDDSYKKYRGYRLSAIDGFKLEINNSDTLRNAFGYDENGTTKVARAMASGIYDIENDKFIAATIVHNKTGEREIATGLIEKIKEMGLKNDLILFDRGYPSTDLISYLEEAGIKYVMRVSTGFLKIVVNTKGEDQDVEIIDKKGNKIKVRVARLMLDSGIEEILITNLSRDEFTVADLKELYFKRWGVEVKYNEVKNRLEIEDFTGDNPIAVKQDFYAAMYLINMVSLAKAEANEVIQIKNEEKSLKYEQKVNTNILIGKLKNSLVSMMLEENPAKRSKMYYDIMSEVYRNVVPIRPERNNPRRKGLKSNKYPLNRKKCL
jgi:hypothetical protein